METGDGEEMIINRVNTLYVPLSLICILLLSASGAAASSFIFVNNSTGPAANYTTIQAAVDNASNRDVILLYQGVYHENVDIAKELSIGSVTADPDSVIVMAEDPEDHVFHISSDNVSIEGLTIMGAVDGSWDDRVMGILLNYSNLCTIRNNKVTGNFEGMKLLGSYNNVVEMNHVFKNINSNGISLEDSHENILESNIVNENWWSGIFLKSSHRNDMINNSVDSNLDGIILYSSCDNDIYSNTANGNNRYGIMLDTGSNGNLLSGNTANLNQDSGICMKYVSSNILEDNVADSNYYQGLLIKFSRDNEVTGNSFSGNTPDVSVDDDTTTSFGIYLTNCDGTYINGNMIHMNRDTGIALHESTYNSVTGNFILGTSTGLSLDHSSHNLISDDHFNNAENVEFIGINFGNEWDTGLEEGNNIVGGSCTGGNFWADPYHSGHSQTCADMDGNGICDLPYQITADDVDNFPLYDPTISCKGDFDHDDNVDFDDFVEFAACYNSMITSNNYHRIFDFESDCDVDFDDFVEFAGHYE